MLGSGENMMPSIDAIEYGYVHTIDLPFEEAVNRTEAALEAEGFGVLCQIDIQAKLKEKLGIDFPGTPSWGPATLPSRTRRFRSRSTSGCCCRATPSYTSEAARFMSEWSMP